VDQAQNQERGQLRRRIRRSAEAHGHAVDGVICGHIHHAAIHERFAVCYVNCGDWVESCIAVAERADGAFEILTWTSDASGRDDQLAQVAAARAA
jgi:UDP-2,3-diacylglucosamine pyrophosphatase LpxH